MLIAEAKLIHLLGVASVFLIPKLTDLISVGVKALIWKYSSHLREGDLVLLSGEEAMISSVNFTGLHVTYVKTSNQRTISVSQLDKLDLRKITRKD